MPELIIKLNDNPMPNDCPLCGKQTNPNIGAELFQAETNFVVCLDCGCKHAPILAALLTFGDISRWFQMLEKPTIGDFLNFTELSKLVVKAENDFGAKWQHSQECNKSPMNTYQDFGFQTEAANVG